MKSVTPEELNRLIAEKVMGWKLHPIHIEGYRITEKTHNCFISHYAWYQSEKYTMVQYGWNPLEDANQAIKALEALGSDFVIEFNSLEFNSQTYYVTISDWCGKVNLRDAYGVIADVSSYKLTHAICLAALKAVTGIDYTIDKS